MPLAGASDLASTKMYLCARHLSGDTQRFSLLMFELWIWTVVVVSSLRVESGRVYENRLFESFQLTES